MARTTRCLSRCGFMMLVLALLAGCPTGPVLVVSPQSLHFDAASTVKTFRIANAGIGTMTYTVVEDSPWFDVVISAPQAAKAQLQGSTSNEPVFFDVVIDRSQLSLGDSFGAIQVFTNGGNMEVNVSASVTGPAALQLSGTTLDLGFDQDRGTITLGNSGSSTLTWTATVDPGSSWLTVNGAGSATGTVASGGSAITLLLEANRDGLPAGNYSGIVNVATNAGNQQILVTLQVPSFVLTPLSIDFGALITPQSVSVEISNRSLESINLSLAPVTAGGGDWLDVQPAVLVLAAGPAQTVMVEVDPTGLPTAVFEGEVIVTDVDTSFSQTITVRMEKVGFLVAPTEIDFGDIGEAATDAITFSNLGQSASNWSISIPASAPWLSVDAGSGSLGGGLSTDVALIADPAQVEPGTYTTTLTVSHANGTVDVLVRMRKPREPALEVSSRNLNFGGSGTAQFLGVIHAGDFGTIQWSINTSGLPPWLSITTTDSRITVTGTTLSGTLTATENNRSHGMTVRVRRDLAPEGLVDFSYTLTVVGSGDVTTTIPVQVSMSVPPLPQIVIDAGAVDEFGVDYINIPSTQTSGNFRIINSGTAQLEWSIALANLPGWISAVTPNRGTLQPSTSVLVAVSINRAGQSFGTLTHTLNIASNDPQRDVVPVRVETQVPKIIQIGTRGTLDFGSEGSVLALDVANIGDPDTILNFKVVPSKEWVSVFPDTGQSRGTAGPLKDWRSLSVAIDRTQLLDTASSATLTVFAFEIVNGEEVPKVDVAPVEVSLSAEAASLNIEVALPRVRIPSLVRYDMLMRNIRFQTIDFTKQTEFERLQQQFRISENDVALELSETSQFVRDGNNLRTNLLILLDYSNSMVEAAKTVEDPTISGAANPLQALYESCLIPMIGELPDRFRVAIAVFNERRGPLAACPVSFETLRVVTADDGGPVFISDKLALIARIVSINVTDNGASELYPAVLDAVSLLSSEDEKLISFDETDVRALVCITDGRVTTTSIGSPPPSSLTLSDVLDALESFRVRFYSVGWGINVLANPLLQMADISGGHYYTTKTVRAGQPDAFGRILRLPLASELRGWFAADLLALDAQALLANFDTLDADGDGRLSYTEALGGLASLPERDFARIDLDGNGFLQASEIVEAVDVLTICDQSIPKDLQSFVTLSYVTLNEEPNATVEVKLTFDDENDNDSICLPEDQGDISANFAHGQLPFDAIAGDVRLGQISVRSEGIQPDDETAIVRLRAEYIPRNVTQLRLRITPIGAPSPNISLVSATNGGIVSRWNLVQAGAVVDIISPDGTPLAYGEYGQLVDLHFQNVSTEFSVDLAVEFPVISAGNNDSKYFTITDRFEVRTTPSFAQAFPHPEIRTAPATLVSDCPVTVDLGQDNDTAVFEVHNVGGHHSPTGVWLTFLVAPGPDSGFLQLPNFLLDDIPEVVASSKTPFTVNVGLDRTGPPGIYIGSLEFVYGFGSVNVGLTERPIFMTYEVLSPQLVISTNTLAFGTTQTDLPLVLSNGGQSTLNWSINVGLLPQWIGVGESSGSLVYDSTPDDGTPNTDTQTFLVSVFRDGMPPGNYSADILIRTDSGIQQTVVATMTVPAP